MTTRAEIVGWARECLDTPFHHQGRIAGIGLDCAGVICHAAARAGLPYDDVPGYGRNPCRSMLETILDAQPGLVRVTGEPQPGDVLLLRLARDPQHLGICTGAGIIHAYETVGKCVEHDMDAAWRRRIVRVYRFAGLEA